MSKHYHFIGIGGIGMGTLASLILAKGHRVSGSDVKRNYMVMTLEEKGAVITIGHRAENVGGADVVIYSSAIREENLEMAAAKKLGIPILQRAQLLAELMANQIGITVAGAHGKTTTTSMTSNLLIQAGLHPTTAVGGIINGDSYHSTLGDGQYFVSEVDESDGSFLYFKPYYSIITNIDFEHVDYYQNLENILNAYRKFIQQVHPDGVVIACQENSYLREVIKNLPGTRIMTYGFSSDSDVFAKNVLTNEGTIQFDCMTRDRQLGAVHLNIPGEHNVLNALACICLGLNLSIDFSVIQKSLQSYQGVKRRFQKKGKVGNILVVDDYAHHPTEIEATLKAARSLNPKRIIAVFQPHRYTRTKFLMEEFVKSLRLSDVAIVTDIYAASESPIDGVSGQELCNRLKQSGFDSAIYAKKDEILYFLMRMAKAGDCVLTLGAGDIYRIGEDLVYLLNDKYKDQQSSRAGIKVKELREMGNIGVLMGGPSSEREISLKSGKAVYNALKQAGCQVTEIMIDSTDAEQIVSQIHNQNVDVAFLALHGKFGEDGGIQTILDEHQIPYTGSDATASRIANNKALCQSIFQENGLPVPRHKIINNESLYTTEEIIQYFVKFPLVVKPACEGSSIGISIVDNNEAMWDAVVQAFRFGSDVLIEEHIAGREFTVGILDGEALPLIEIKPQKGFFDFTAKYYDSTTQYIIPVSLTPDIQQRIQQLALKAYRLIGCRDMARIDFICDVQLNPYVLEVNTIPGFTSSSLLPMAAKHIGCNFETLCLKIADLGYKKKLRIKCKEMV